MSLRWFDRTRIAEHLGVKPRTVTELVKRGMPVSRTNGDSGHLRFDVDAVDVWFKDQPQRRLAS